MKYYESETVELKEVFTDDIKKEVIAMANSYGGVLYIGVSDDGEIVGIDDVDGTIQKVSNAVRDNIKPDITMFLRYEIKHMEQTSILAVHIQQGTNRPYYLSKKGLRPEGVYVRQGTSSAPASETLIRKMIKETDGTSFEMMRSLDQELTFETTAREFKVRNLEFQKVQMRTMSLLNKDDIYTNVGYLLSDQCQHSIKVAVFQGNNQNTFKGRKEFTGSVLKQLNETYAYIDFINQVHSTFEGLYRIDVRDFPESAIRESLLNMVIHKDYSYRASTLISIYNNRIELVSIGGLVEGLEIEDILTGISMCRNEKLANVFYRLQLIEAYGTGIRKIINAYEGTDKTPIFEATANTFKITLPNLNYEDDQNTEIGLDDKESTIIQLLESKRAITRKDIDSLLHTSQATSSRILKKMLEKGVLNKRGDGKNSSYRLSPHYIKQYYKK